LKSKNTFLSRKNDFSKNNIALFFIAVMLVGLLCSRSLASIGMFLFGMNALRGVHPRRWLRQRWWLGGLIWIGMYALSWFWSGDKGEWNAHVQVKLPFLLLPLAFGFLDPWTPTQLRLFTIIFSTAMICGMLYSLSFFIRFPQEYIAGYKYSHTLPTPAYNDHISFSTGVALCVAWCVYSWRLWASELMRVVVFFVVIMLSLYLHILAAKTGLVALYVFWIGYFIYLFFVRRRQALLLLVMLAGSCYTAYQFIPTLRERINYTLYTYKQYRSGERSGLYSDAGRLISYNVAAAAIRAKPLTGAGAGDVMKDMSNIYAIRFPQIPEERQLYPHNQFLTTAVAVGLPAAAALVLWLLAPFLLLRRNRDSFFFVVVWLMLLVPLFVDPFLEVQAGVFVYLFFFLMQRSLLALPLVARPAVSLQAGTKTSN
jgi:O-antigen ligase